MYDFSDTLEWVHLKRPSEKCLIEVFLACIRPALLRQKLKDRDFKTLEAVAFCFHESFEKNVKEYLFLQSQGAFDRMRIVNFSDNRTMRPPRDNNNYSSNGMSSRSHQYSNGPITAPVFSNMGSYSGERKMVHSGAVSGTRTPHSSSSHHFAGQSVGTDNNNRRALVVHQNNNTPAPLSYHIQAPSNVRNNVSATPGLDRHAYQSSQTPLSSVKKCHICGSSAHLKKDCPKAVSLQIYFFECEVAHTSTQDQSHFSPLR